jgi:hypothetical protein
MDKSGRSSAAQGSTAVHSPLQTASGWLWRHGDGAGHRIRAVAATVAQHHDELVGRRAHQRLHGLCRLSTMTQFHQSMQRARGADRLAMADDLHLQLDWRGTGIRLK